MTRKEMDKLNVGDRVEVKRYNTSTEQYEWIPTIITKVLVCSDGGEFAHGGYHSVEAKINGFTEILDNELTRIADERIVSKKNNGSDFELLPLFL